MPTPHRLRDVVVSARERLVADRDKARQQHLSGSPGIQVCSRLTDALDQVILEVYEAAQSEQGGGEDFASSFALIPHGGYGRRDVAPFSDVDLMLLRHPNLPAGRVEEFSKRLVADLSDIGFDLGFSVRTPHDAIQLSRVDPIIFSSQVESRFLAGSIRLFTRYMRNLRRYAMNHAQPMIRKIELSRSEERSRFGETVYLLEPNIKRSRGGLRDIHLLRWVGFARYGETDPSQLRLLNALGRDDALTIRRAHEFLLRLRNEMHFHAGKTSDVLNRGEQMRIAEAFGYQGREGVLPVEEFMRDYFEATRSVRDVVDHFVADAKERPWGHRLFGPLVTHRINGHYRVGPKHIRATNRGLNLLRGNLDEVLRLMVLANQMNKRIEHRTWAAIRDSMSGGKSVEVTPVAAKRFMWLMNYTSRLGSILRRLHELRVLEQLVIGLDHARCLLQFNRYHKYTVDEHCIQAVERCTGFQFLDSSLGRAYRGAEKRNLLHLALLIHDLGKGFTRDHCDVGRELAAQTAERLGLSEQDSEMLQFLVQNHLIMSHLTFRRDTSDLSVIIDFTKEVGTAERLRMLFVFTAADLAAVGPDVLNPWKVDVLTEVYRTARNQLSGGGRTSITEWDAESIRNRLRNDHQSDAWLCRQIDSLPPAYLRESSRETIAHDLERLRELQPNSAIAWGKFMPDRHVTEYTIGVNRTPSLGVFHRLTGALTSHRLNILSAQIHTLADDLLLDRFHVVDEKYVGEPPESRLREISRAMMMALDPATATDPVFPALFKKSTMRTDELLEVLPTRVSIDNSTSLECTILDVFTHDRDGLLYEITRVLYELGTSVSYAKIGTYLDQVVDVFYLTEEDGSKIRNESRLAEISEGVARAIELHRNA